MELRDNISERRRAVGLTQEEMANRLNVSRQTIGKWESGKAVPELEKLISLCDLLGCTLDELVGRTDMRPYQARGGNGLSGTDEAGGGVSLESLSPVDSDDGAKTLRSKRLVMRAGILATGVCALVAAAGFLFFLFGPWPVENIEVRLTALFAAALGAFLGVVLVATSKKAELDDVETLVASLVNGRKWKTVVLVVSIGVVLLAVMLFLLTPKTMRMTAFICIELAALAMWPIAFVFALLKDAER